MALITKPSTPAQEAQARAKYLTGLIWHAGAFVIINVFLWLLDAWGPGGINWAYIITAAWAFALAFHALAWFVDGRQLERRKAEEYLDKERDN